MKLTSAALFCYLLYSFPEVPSGVTIEGGCPSESDIKPCKCTDVKDINKKPFQTLTCKHLSSVPELKKVFSHEEFYRIEEVDIKFSVLSYIPHDLFDRYLIHALYIQDVRMIKLFDEPPKDASSLSRLSLYNITLQRNLDWSALKTLNNLKSLMVKDIPVKVIGEAFKTYVSKHLKTLAFTNTETRQIIPGSLDDFTDLETLYFRNCKLTKLTRSMFPSDCSHFHDLNFDNNRIEEIPNDLFQNMPKLWRLSMRNNNIKTIPESAFLGSQLDGPLEFQGNPIRCNCKLQWIFKLLDKESDLSFFGKCDSPDKLKNKLFENLKSSDFDCEN